MADTDQIGKTIAKYTAAEILLVMLLGATKSCLADKPSPASTGITAGNTTK